MMEKIALWIMVCAVIIMTGCRKENRYAYLRDRAIPAEIEVVSESSRAMSNSYVGEITAKANMPLVFPLGGQLTSLQVKGGQSVREGQVIATVDDTQAKALLESSEAMLRQAEDGYSRLKAVHDKGGLSDVKWVEMETNLEKARSMAISSRKRYEDCTLRACRSGVVNLNPVEEGQSLAVGQPIGMLMDLSGRKACFTVPESEIGTMHIGDKVRVVLPALDKTYSAEVDDKSMVATHLAHMYRVTALIDDREDVDDLLPGMVCRVVVTNTEASGYVVSAGCIQTQQRGHSVWVLRNGRTERQMVKISAFVENGVLVSEGLQAGDTVIAKGYQKMYQGARVSF